MAPFDPEDALTHPLDFMLVQQGFVTMFWRRSVLDEATGWLVERGYQLASLDSSSWRSDDDMHRDVARALGFPGYYGGNLAALNDCLGDVAAGDYGIDPEATGLVLALVGYDRFHRRSRPTAHRLLDIFASQARAAALFGHRMMLLVQSDDPDLLIDPVGATPVDWNPAEWPRAKRG